VRRSLCAEAIKLGRTLTTLLPDEPEAVGPALHLASADGERRYLARRLAEVGRERT
jgi:hypothetical protein